MSSLTPSILFPTRPPAKLVSLFVCGSVVLLLLVGCNRLSHPKDLASVSITLWRTDCQGFCPVYSVTLRGTGDVEYSGLHGVPVRGHRNTAIPQERVAAILREMENAKFMSFDDRTFAKLSDGGDVIVSLSIDGKNKTVRSSEIEDGFDIPQQVLEKHFNKAQASFAKLADKIDSLIGTDGWTKCSLNCTKLLFVLSHPDSKWSPNLLEIIQSKEPVIYGSLVCDANTMIEAGVGINTSSQRGVTPLMAATKIGDAALVRDLLAHGAIPGAKDKNGLTALDYAKTSEIRKLLTGNG
jgi:hypothetical protein